MYDGLLVGEGLPGDPVGKKQDPTALSLPVQKGEGLFCSIDLSVCFCVSTMRFDDCSFVV